MIHFYTGLSKWLKHFSETLSCDIYILVNALLENVSCFLIWMLYECLCKILGYHVDYRIILYIENLFNFLKAIDLYYKIYQNIYGKSNNWVIKCKSCWVAQRSEVYSGFLKMIQKQILNDTKKDDARLSAGNNTALWQFFYTHSYHLILERNKTADLQFLNI